MVGHSFLGLYILIEGMLENADGVVKSPDARGSGQDLRISELHRTCVFYIQTIIQETVKIE